jgi:hypothetical protein
MHNKKHEYYLTQDDQPIFDTEAKLMIYLSYDDALQMAQWITEETDKMTKVQRKNWYD